MSEFNPSDPKYKKVEDLPRAENQENVDRVALIEKLQQDFLKLLEGKKDTPVGSFVIDDDYPYYDHFVKEGEKIETIEQGGHGQYKSFPMTERDVFALTGHGRDDAYTNYYFSSQMEHGKRLDGVGQSILSLWHPPQKQDGEENFVAQEEAHYILGKYVSREEFAGFKSFMKKNGCHVFEREFENGTGFILVDGDKKA